MKEKMAAAMDKKLELEAKTAGVKVDKKKQSVFSKQKGKSPTMRGDPDGAYMLLTPDHKNRHFS